MQRKQKLYRQKISVCGLLDRWDARVQVFLEDSNNIYSQATFRVTYLEI